MRRNQLVVVALSACLVVVGTVQTSAAGRPVGPLSPPSGAWFGAFVNPNKADPGGSKPEVTALETTLGRTLDVDNRFYNYGVAIPTSLESWDLQQGRIPMITWGAYDTVQLSSGAQDTWLRSQADGLAALGQPVFLRFYHEFDGDYRKAIVHSPADFIAAWRHVHDVFVREGATNVVWVWCPTAWKFKSKTPWPPDYYPGDAYVDWIAADGYNWYPARPGSQWRTFKTIFSDFYLWAGPFSSAHSKPIMIAENGVQEDPAIAGRKAQWITDSATALQTNYPLVQAVLYFHTTITKGGITYPWNVDSTSSSIDAWSAMAADPYFDPVPDP